MFIRQKAFIVSVVAVFLFLATPAAHALPIKFQPAKVSDVDKGHTGQDPYGNFDPINDDETGRCWQAVFANMLHKVCLTADPQKLYEDVFMTRWKNEGKTATEQKTEFNQYFRDNNLRYYSSLYTDLAHLTLDFAKKEIYRCQGVKLGVSGHAFTFWGWDEHGNSLIADSDADLADTNLTAYGNSTDASGRWHITWDSEDGKYSEDWVVENIITICPVPEPATILCIALALSGAIIRRKMRMGTTA